MGTPIRGHFCEGSTPMEVKLNEMVIPEEIKLERAWRLSGQLGAGGFAKVYLAQDENGDPAVVKLVPKEPGAQRELLFEELDGALNVVPILDRGEWSGYWVLVMPLAEKSLRDHLDDAGGQLAVNEAVSVLVDIAEALAEVESRDVVHRDLKPENVLLLDGRWHLADFGIARYAEATTAVDTFKYAKTPAYAAPEQWREERATSATDVYALGVVAYELLTGKRPFLGPDFRGQHLEESPDPITGIPDRLRSLAGECLYKGPEARPRPQNLLARLKASLKAASPAGALLQQANALAVERQTEAERQQLASQVEAERRHDLRTAADQALKNTLAMLDRQIRDNAPTAQASTRSFPNSWTLNDARLAVDSPSVVAAGGDQNLPFEVVSYTKITLVIPQGRDGYTGRSHSLWYCDAQEQGVFRWYDTAFMITFGGGDRRVAPFAMSPGDRDAVVALSPAMHTHQVAWPFTPIDQGDEDSFIERWMGWFGEAAQGRLQYPSRMPELDPSGSWRRGR